MLVGSFAHARYFASAWTITRQLRMEKLVEHLGRIRDVDMGPEFIYVLLEHQDTGSLVRLVPTGAK